GDGAGGGDWNERARRDEAGDADANRAAGQRGGRLRPGRLPPGDELRRALVGAAAGQPQLAAAARGMVLKGQPGLVQPPVERVEPGPPADTAERGKARALGAHVEFRSERYQRGRRNVIPRLRIAT